MWSWSSLLWSVRFCKQWRLLIPSITWQLGWYFLLTSLDRLDVILCNYWSKALGKCLSGLIQIASFKPCVLSLWVLPHQGLIFSLWEAATGNNNIWFYFGSYLDSPDQWHEWGFIHNSQKLKSTFMFLNQRVDKENAHLCKMEYSSTLWNNDIMKLAGKQIELEK